jgi:hypothetical protein
MAMIEIWSRSISAKFSQNGSPRKKQKVAEPSDHAANVSSAQSAGGSGGVANSLTLQGRLVASGAFVAGTA